MASILRRSTVTPPAEMKWPLKKADRGPAEFALAGLSVKLVVTQGLEHHPNMAAMLLAGAGENEDIVHIYLHELAEHGRRGPLARWKWSAQVVEGEGRAPEDRVHITHEQRGHAVQAEGAHTELVLPTGDAERRLVLVRRADAELVVARSQVELGEEAGTTSLVDELILVWQRFHGRLRDGRALRPR